MRRWSNVVLAATGLLIALSTGCAIGEAEDDVPTAGDASFDISMSADVQAGLDATGSDVRADTTQVRDNGPDTTRTDVPFTSDRPISVDVPMMSTDVPVTIDVPMMTVDVPAPVDTFVPPPDVPIPVDVPIFLPDTGGGGGGPGAFCAVDTDCSADGANCCANISGLRICACRLFGTCNPLFCM